tara:strand:+ start:117 stop:926 length:810 start_codon:yes stop_codon:yes gene_type:complete
LGYSKYPNELDDSTTLPPSTDLITPVKAEVVNRLRDAVLAVEMELGAQTSGAFGTVKARLDAMQAQLTTVAQDLDALEAEIGPNPSGTFDTVVERLNDIDSQFAALQVQIAALEADLESQITALDTDLQSQIDALTLALAASRQVVTPIISGSQDTNSDTLVAKGACLLNPNDLGNPVATFTLEAIIQTTDASYAATLEIFNITEGVVVAHPVITTTSTSPTFISVTLTIGGADLPAAQNNILEGRLSLGSGAASSDRAICKYAAIRSA